MKILLFSTKDFNDGENMREYVDIIRKAGFNSTQEIYSVMSNRLSMTETTIRLYIIN